MQTTADALRAHHKPPECASGTVAPPNHDPPARAAPPRCGTFIEGPP
jgi:hypothetical protein